MSNVLEGDNSQGGGLALLNRLRLMRYAYQSGLFTASTTLPLPEIVANGHGPDDWLGGSPEGAPGIDGSCRRNGAFRVAPDLQGRPFCARCGALQRSLGDSCPVCGNP